MKNYFVSLLIMIVFIVVGAGAASASVIEKVTDVDIGVIELAKNQGVEITILMTHNYDYILTHKVNIQDIIKEYSLEVAKDIYTPKSFYISFYNDDHRSDWLKKEITAGRGFNSHNDKSLYWRLHRTQHRSQGQSS